MKKGLKKFLTLLENTGDAVWVVDGAQQITHWNNAAERLLGYGLDQVIGRQCYEVLGGRDLGDKPICRARCDICEYACEGLPITSFDTRIIDREGRSIWINVSSIVIPAENADNFKALIHLARLVEQDGPMAPSLKIRLLGPVSVQRSDGSIVAADFQRRAKVRALFSILALHRSQGVRRDELLSRLWPDKERRAGLHNLNTAVYYLRHSLEPALEHGPESSYIQNRGERYFLTGGRNNWLDVEEFEAKIAAAHREKDKKKKEMYFREAIALYRGEYLADLDAYQLDFWSDRERYRQLYLDAMQSLGDLLLDRQRQGEAVELFRRVIAEAPCREAVARKLMRLALRQGKRLKAIKQYERLKDNLERELDLEPSQKTRQLGQKAKKAQMG